MSAPRRRLLPLLALGVALAAACSDPGTEPRPRPGEVELILQSPFGDEGGAVLALPAARVLRVTAPDDAMAYVAVEGGEARIAVALGRPGAVRLLVATDDAGADLTGTVLEVAAPDNTLRPALEGYRLVTLPVLP